MNDSERLLIAQAIYKAVASEVKTGEDNLRGRVDAEYLDLYEKTGAKSFDMRLNGEKVGTYSVRVTEPKVRDELAVVNYQALCNWAEENGCMMPDMAAIQRCFEETGEVPDGCVVERIETEGRATPSLRVDAQKVADVMGAQLPDAVRGLLEGGENG